MPTALAATTNPLADELTTGRRAEPCALVIFGASGDLTKRKLVPSLMGLAKDGLLPPSFAVVGFARRPWSDEEFRNEVRAGLQQFGRRGAPAMVGALADRVRDHPGSNTQLKLSEERRGDVEWCEWGWIGEGMGE